MATDNLEKQPIEETGSEVVPSTPKSAGHHDEPLDPKAERKLLWKLDLIILPVFFIIYMMSFLDRINISNAVIQGMDVDLDLTGNRFNVALFVSTHPPPPPPLPPPPCDLTQPLVRGVIMFLFLLLAMPIGMAIIFLQGPR
jgi:hypothetical protein